jgi:hypothetical protein
MFQFELLRKRDWALVAAMIGGGLLLIWLGLHWLTK